jgi:hypothetical protein
MQQRMHSGKRHDACRAAAALQAPNSGIPWCAGRAYFRQKAGVMSTNAV